MSHHQSLRDKVVAEALTWVGTPYAHNQRCKGSGVDCGQLLIGVFSAAGVIPNLDRWDYPADWHLHRNEEQFLQNVERFARKTDNHGPGDIALFRYGRCISHGSIVIDWPVIIHAYVRQGVVFGDVKRDADLAKRFVGCWSMWW